MLVEVSEVLALPEYTGANPETVARKILAVEAAIRAYTNNAFMVRGARMQVPSAGGLLQGTSPFIKAGDRVMVARSAVADSEGRPVVLDINNGLYDVEAVTEYYTALGETLYNADLNDVFLVKYPEAIKAGAMEMLKWDAAGRTKLGVASETISRHSVSYYQYTDAEMVEGYPAAIMGFLKPYKKARF